MERSSGIGKAVSYLGFDRIDLFRVRGLFSFTKLSRLDPPYLFVKISKEYLKFNLKNWHNFFAASNSID